MDRRTPLYDLQKAMGAKFTSFGGWELPVSYTDIIKEHHNVRTKAGLFDVSHMGEILVTGKDAMDFINSLITNDITPVPDGKALYSPMCYENGTVVDDILIYKFSDIELLLIVNAGNIEKDEAWIRSRAFGDVRIENLSDRFAQLALQGPLAETVMKKLCGKDTELPKFFRFTEVELLGMKVLLSRTGYTGEDGFEIYLWLPNPCADPKKLWDGLLEAGKDEGICPSGLGARDTLRLEAALPLYGHELSDAITPMEVGLQRFVKLEKNSFIGKEALLTESRQLKRKLYGFEMLDRGIPRNGYEVLKGGKPLGYVTSGGIMPTLSQNGGLALLEDTGLSAGDLIQVIIRDRSCSAKIVPVPFYGKKYKK